MEAQALFGGFCAGDFYPGWEYLVDRVSGFRRRLERSLEDMTNICDEIIKEHVDRSTDSREEDFVDVLFRAQRREDLEVPITDDNLKALVMVMLLLLNRHELPDMFVVETDTTSAVLEWTLTELVRHPEMMKKAQEEVRKIACSAGTVDKSHHRHFHYMKAVVKETMGLHPPVPLLVP
ncbi:hypothetical protein TIFTF001_018269 [Ficus carica]|uniref:Uncharacterized protein n=1 Tax=Ficus carica TaxID=3494 RepID=A0AA88AN30_FICCA|nr:hypothetical protein TIFTF001_018269 [Ficus carica]